MSLDRFKTAQASPEGGFEPALAELRAGQKRSHWIWYVFPQLTGLGRSSTARYYALQGRDEARDYLRDPELGPRLQAAAGVVASHLAHGVRLTELMGGTIDALKLVSSLTLFERVAKDTGDAAFAMQCDQILAAAARQGFPRCPQTLAQMDGTD